MTRLPDIVLDPVSGNNVRVDTSDMTVIGQIEKIVHSQVDGIPTVNAFIQTDDRQTVGFFLTTNILSLELELYRITMPTLYADLLAGNQPTLDVTVHPVTSIDRVSTDDSATTRDSHSD